MIAGPGLMCGPQAMARLRVFLLAKPKRDSQTLERIDRGVGEGRETLSNTRTRVKNNTYVQEG